MTGSQLSSLNEIIILTSFIHNQSDPNLSKFVRKSSPKLLLLLCLKARGPLNPVFSALGQFSRIRGKPLIHGQKQIPIAADGGVSGNLDAAVNRL